MTLWEERAGRNQALFRAVNEHVEELHKTHGSDEVAEFVCECADDSCTEQIPVPLRIYEQVRANPRRFIIHPGHQHSELELVVDVDERYMVVEKHGAAGRVAAVNDPRR
jgi:hypothetical protein